MEDKNNNINPSKIIFPEKESTSKKMNEQKLQNDLTLVNNIAFTLKTLQLQNQKLAKYQESSYLWHQQHHNNLKKIMQAINRLAQLMEEKFGLGDFKNIHIEPEENKSLLSSQNLQSESLFLQTRQTEKTNPELNFNQFILSFQKNLHSKDLEQVLLETTNEKFQQLQEDSLYMLFPLMIEWLSDEITSKRYISLVFLFETVKKYPEICDCKTESRRALVKKFFTGLENVMKYDSQIYESFEAEELELMRTFLFKKFS